jgi:hypothetical protein
MPNDPTTASSISADPFHVNDEVRITITRHRFEETFTYNADIVGTGNTISGGGTRTKEIITWGYQIKVENIGDQPRRYFFEWEIFSDSAKTVLQARRRTTTDVLRPGQITYLSIDAKVAQEYDLQKVLVTKAQIVEENNNVYLVQSKVIWDLWSTTHGLNITGASSVAAKAGAKLVNGCLSVVVLFAFFAGIIALMVHFK